MKNKLAIVALLWVGASGCAATNFTQKSGDLAPIRGQRREQAMRQFEMHRDNAQYQSALERWRAGDRFTCEAELKSLIARNPKHVEAHQALADLAMERGDEATAEAQLRELLKLAPEDAQTHHSLGLLLESQNRIPEARTHLERAAQLDPDSTLYQLCLQGSPSPATDAVAQRP